MIWLMMPVEPNETTTPKKTLMPLKASVLEPGM